MEYYGRPTGKYASYGSFKFLPFEPFLNNRFYKRFTRALDTITFTTKNSDLVSKQQLLKLLNAVSTLDTKKCIPLNLFFFSCRMFNMI